MPDRNKNKNYHFLIWLFLILDLLVVVGVSWHAGGFALFSPKGTIAANEKKVIITAVLLMLIVVVPVLSAAILISRKYRADNPRAEYQPEWVGNKKLQFLWWAFPGLIVVLLGVLTWKASHALDPFKPIDSGVRPLTIEVVALNWKWLFIYPQQDIAAVNLVEFPENTPVNFVLTADAPMNSFWIPQLGGQMYAMAGMSTQLHLIADQTGTFEGSAAEINGKGFSGMRFAAKAVSDADFAQWVASAKSSSKALSLDAYNQLAQPSIDQPQMLYAPVEDNLYNLIMQKYMPIDAGMASGMNMQMDMDMPMPRPMNMSGGGK